MTAILGQERTVDLPSPDGLSRPRSRWIAKTLLVSFADTGHEVDLSTEPSDHVAELSAAGEEFPEASEGGPRQTRD